jgi:hypothetical protein
MGLNVEGVSDALSQVPELERMAEELAAVPDRFKRREPLLEVFSQEINSLSPNALHFRS